MNAFEIAGAIILLLACVTIIGVVMMQESKSNGMSAVSGADSGANFGKNRAKTKEVLLNKVTKVAAIIFFVISLAVCILSVYVK